ncbi:2Fe-2S iron-sulfur cluster-binding protein, partial [Specibacter sp. AOP5-B1-6]|uniref:2Fe-2S iron-sulfur cluster-binding protein n=1 Tax=Specibacter sp. AOP5-B1-6 TaxID=3457653 RepID=UPI00402B0803
MTGQNNQPNRLTHGGRIDRNTTLNYTVDGIGHVGHPGDTVASALIANGRLTAGNSLYEDRPRGILSAGVEESNALIKVAGRFPGHAAESMLPATTV